ncbi:Uncharacterised protein [Mycobacteroides abscessus subsp. abscessus]|nr:Uncharacterised protein [Mycobacteroides abscessus subsp. abscessus]
MTWKANAIIPILTRIQALTLAIQKDTETTLAARQSIYASLMEISCLLLYLNQMRWKMKSCCSFLMFCQRRIGASFMPASKRAIQLLFLAAGRSV